MFIGTPQRIVPFPFSPAQCAWVARVFAGRISLSLPYYNEMRGQWIAEGVLIIVVRSRLMRSISTRSTKLVWERRGRKGSRMAGVERRCYRTTLEELGVRFDSERAN